MEVRILACGDSAVSVRFGNEISPEVAGKVWRLRDALKAEMEAGHCDGIIAMVPSYTALLVQYDPMVIGYHEIQKLLIAVYGACSNGGQGVTATRIVEVPVLYGGEQGPDMDYVCEHTGLSADEIISIHTKPDYLIYMLGFTPGFPYLGGMDKRIATPRLKVPRVKLEAGAVGIAGEQTGIYPISSPGGWQIIGNTPIKLYDVKANDPILLRAGDYLRFRSITRAEYQQIRELSEKGEYQPIISHREVNR